MALAYLSGGLFDEGGRGVFWGALFDGQSRGSRIRERGAVMCSFKT